MKVLFSVLVLALVVLAYAGLNDWEKESPPEMPESGGNGEEAIKIVVNGETPSGYPQPEIIKAEEVTLIYGEDLTTTKQGQEAVDWLLNFLNDGINDDLYYVRLVIQDIQYLNATNSTFSIREYYCRRVCASGSWDKDSREITLYNKSNAKSVTLGTSHDSQVAFTYLHETGHLILDMFANESEREEWEYIHINVTTDELREYARTTPHEDFADSYALYRLGVFHQKERLEFIKKIEEKAGVIKWEE
mgnify:CR=1 FL=1